MLIDEPAETIKLLNRLPEIVRDSNRTNAIIQEEAVIALCEKKIKEFIRGILINQHGAEIIPEISIVYANGSGSATPSAAVLSSSDSAQK